jgi:two-component system response regulator HydG
MSPDEYFIRFVEKLQPQYNQTEIAGMPGISRKSLWEKRQDFDIPAHN